MEFKVGDRVVYDPEGENHLLRGQEGTIRWAREIVAGVGVEFDNYSPLLHDLQGRCRDGHGWWCFAESLQKAEQPSFPALEIEFDSFFAK